MIVAPTCSCRPWLKLQRGPPAGAIYKQSHVLHRHHSCRGIRRERMVCWNHDVLQSRPDFSAAPSFERDRGSGFGSWPPHYTGSILAERSGGNEWPVEIMTCSRAVQTLVGGSGVREIKAPVLPPDLHTAPAPFMQKDQEGANGLLKSWRVAEPSSLQCGSGLR